MNETPASSQRAGKSLPGQFDRGIHGTYNERAQRQQHDGARMDQVKLTRMQVKHLAEQDEGLYITATNEDTGQIFVEREKYVGQNKGKWMLPNGKYRKEG